MLRYATHFLQKRVAAYLTAAISLLQTIAKLTTLVRIYKADAVSFKAKMSLPLVGNHESSFELLSTRP